MWVVYKAVRKWVIQNNRKRLVTLFKLIKFGQEYLELRIGGTVTLSKGIIVIQMSNDFVKHSFYSSVDCSQSARLQFKFYFWNL